MIEDLGKMEGVQEKEKGESPYQISHSDSIPLLDPEELLNLLFKNILHIPPFIQIRYRTSLSLCIVTPMLFVVHMYVYKLYTIFLLVHLSRTKLTCTTSFFCRRSFGVEDEFFIQLFISFDQTLRLPTIKELTRKMFDEGKLSLTKVNCCHGNLLILRQNSKLKHAFCSS